MKNGGRFLYIPIALRGHRLYATAKAWMKSVLELHKRNDITFDIVDDLSLYTEKDLATFDAFYIGGGNTWSLLQELKSSGCADALISCINNGIPVYGGSAGAIVLGTKIDTHDDENNIHSQDCEGFGVLGKYSVTCHFDSKNHERFKHWSLTNNLPIVCLSEETGLVIEDTRALCVGEKSCFIYEANGDSREVLPGESFTI